MHVYVRICTSEHNQEENLRKRDLKKKKLWTGSDKYIHTYLYSTVFILRSWSMSEMNFIGLLTLFRCQLIGLTP